MNSLIRNISKQRIKIVSVYALAQILNIYSIVVIGRNYPTEQYGIYVLVSSLAGIIITFSNGKYHNNIVSSNQLLQKKQLIWLSIIITFSINLLFIIILFLLPHLFTNFNYLNESLYFIPVPLLLIAYCVFAGLNILTDAILNDKEQYLRMSIGRLVKATFFLIGIILFKNLGWKALLLSILLAQFFQLLFNGFSLLKALESYYPNKTDLRQASIEFKSSPKYNILLSLLISSTDYIVYTIIKQFWGIGFLGNFSLAEKLIKLPVALIGQPLSEQFFKKNASHYNADSILDLKQHCIQYLKLGFLILILPMFIAYFFSKDLVALFLPSQWQAVGWIASILAPVMLFYFILASWRSLSIVLKIQRQHFWVELICFITFCSIIILSGIFHLNEFQLVVLKMISEVCVSIVIIKWFYDKINTLTTPDTETN
ncbi:MAG TPA: hypothetical protein VK590_09950 [Saprospiraceae bacterium]|nr:hypothetical protein [Saprospiraceae bacterium]